MSRTVRGRKAREPFGRIRQLRSGRYQAAYTGPDLALHKATATFGTLIDARGWLMAERHADRRRDLDRPGPAERGPGLRPPWPGIRRIVVAGSDR